MGGDLRGSSVGCPGGNIGDSGMGVGGTAMETEVLLDFLHSFLIPFMLITVVLFPVFSLTLSLPPVDDPDKFLAIDAGTSMLSLVESAEKRLEASLFREGASVTPVPDIDVVRLCLLFWISCSTDPPKGTLSQTLTL